MYFFNKGEPDTDVLCDCFEYFIANDEFTMDDYKLILEFIAVDFHIEGCITDLFFNVEG